MCSVVGLASVAGCAGEPYLPTCGDDAIDLYGVYVEMENIDETATYDFQVTADGNLLSVTMSPEDEQASDDVRVGRDVYLARVGYEQVFPENTLSVQRVTPQPEDERLRDFLGPTELVVEARRDGVTITQSYRPAYTSIVEDEGQCRYDTAYETLVLP